MEKERDYQDAIERAAQRALAKTQNELAVFGWVSEHGSDEMDWTGDGAWRLLSDTSRTRYRHDRVISCAQARAEGLQIILEGEQ